MTVFLLRQVIAVVVILGCIGISDAAEIRCVDYYSAILPEGLAQKSWPSGRRPTSGSSCFEALLVGRIGKGDYEKTVGFYGTHHPFLRSVRLNSTGGSVDEAIKIGRLFRKYLITAWAPIGVPPNVPALWKVCSGQNCTCASACSLIWFGAVHRNGSVGLHRPRTDDPTFRALSPAEASVVYRQMLDRVARYLEEMEAPKSMIDAMVATGSAEMRWVDASEEGFERPPSIAEWEDASCGSITVQENSTFLQLMGALAAKKPLTQQEQLAYKLLLERTNIRADEQEVAMRRRSAFQP